jgi:tripartite-type tricarboxylate transporter receptor subunit TctC
MKLRFLALIVLGTALAGPARAADLPNRPIRFVVSFTPGAGPDIAARALVDVLSRKWPLTPIVDNRPGADGAIATEFVARGPADGSSLLLATMGNIALLPVMSERLPYDPANAFRGVTFVSDNPFVLMLPTTTSIRSVNELVALSKTRELTFGSAGTLGPLIGKLVVRRTGARLNYVPYKGTQPAIVDLMGGRIDLVIADLSTALATSRQGRAKLLAISGDARSTLAPEVPTMIESGIRDFDYSTWYSVVAPRATPDELVARLNADIVEALAHPDVVRQLYTLGMVARSSSAKAMDELMVREMDRWARVVRGEQ